MDKEVGKMNSSSQTHQAYKGRHVGFYWGCNPWTHGFGRRKELVPVETACLKLAGGIFSLKCLFKYCYLENLCVTFFLGK